MSSASKRPGPVELDLKRYEVRVDGAPLKLERHPMELLILLLERPGALVTRQAIARRLWGDRVFVDADQGINTAVSKIRHALLDDPDRPSFLQTVVGKGYRFMGPVVHVTGDAPSPVGSTPAVPAGRFAVTWEGRNIPLVDGVNMIGRDPDSAIRIDSTMVSRRHAQIVVSDAAVTIEDLGSKNATRVNGEKLDAPTLLSDYDVIQIGPVTLICRLPSATGSTLTAGDR
jgi:DNA-binding winged helix-turn-helix (wHTH) protein